MSYKALYRTYRPTTFAEVVGQEHIISTLKNIINKKKVSHAYLFAGPRGTGKTTVANVFAKTLNCTETLGFVKPCGKCEQCIIPNSMDIIEIDAASNNGVSEIRNLIDNSRYVPTNSKKKIYIIDEVHMLSKGAFNALLKTLEEPPTHVVFILATTEPHKIPITILSRTQRFNFKRIDNKIIKKQLEYVLKKENILFDDDAISAIAKLANGGMRDALSIADQASAFSNGNISFETISQVFGVVSIDNQIELINLAYSNSVQKMLNKASVYIDNGNDIERLVISLIEVVKDFLIFQKTNDKNLMSSLLYEDVKTFKISVQFAYQTLDILMETINNLKSSEVPRQLFELALLKMVNNSIPINEGLNNNLLEKQKIISNLNSEKLENNIFETQELVKSFDEKLDSKKLEEIKKEIEETGEFEIPQEILEEDDDETMIQEDILTTQEIFVSKGDKIVESTQEIDVMSLFKIEDNIDENNDTNKYKPKIDYSIDEILNLLVQAKRVELNNIKEKWPSIISHSANPKYNFFITLLNNTKIISAGDEFILVSNEDAEIINHINNSRKDLNFLELLNDVFGKPFLIFAITREQFNIVKNSWIKKDKTNSLPNARPIEKVKITKKEVNEIDDFGTKIFGDLFKH